MKFKVTRTTEWDDDVAPCEEAVQEPYVRLDIRTVDDPKKLHRGYKDYGEGWYQEGSNHRVVNGHIVRDFDKTGWFIEINTLEELMEFKRKYGDLVVTNTWDNFTIPCIEIYDGYRE